MENKMFLLSCLVLFYFLSVLSVPFVRLYPIFMFVYPVLILWYPAHLLSFYRNSLGWAQVILLRWLNWIWKTPYHLMHRCSLETAWLCILVSVTSFIFFLPTLVFLPEFFWGGGFAKWRTADSHALATPWLLSSDKHSSSSILRYSESYWLTLCDIATCPFLRLQASPELTWWTFLLRDNRAVSIWFSIWNLECFVCNENTTGLKPIPVWNDTQTTMG